jgi:ADP-ribose pyrophosphatase YjhB (NUDIX family)
MSAVDHAIKYNKGWAVTKDLLDKGEDPNSIYRHHADLKDSYSAGVRDCIQQYLKTGNGEMIKIAVVIVVFDPVTGHVLAATRRGTTDDWGFIGGKTDGEAPLDAALREFQEETGRALIAVPDYVGCFKDEEDWDIHVYIVTDRVEAKMICDEFRCDPREIEPGILVTLVPYREVMVKTFGEFNIDLIPHLLKVLL